MADGWLCDSILNTAAQPSPMLTAPAFSPGPCTTAGPVEGSRRSSAFELLYEQCSDQSTPSMPSSTSLGARFSCSRMTRYSSGVSATSLSLRSNTAKTKWPPAGESGCSRHQHLEGRFGHRAGEFQGIGSPELPPGAALRVGHHAKDVAPRVDVARDVVQRAVRVRRRHDASVRVAVAQHNLPPLLELRKGRRVGEVVALAV